MLPLLELAPPVVLVPVVLVPVPVPVVLVPVPVPVGLVLVRVEVRVVAVPVVVMSDPVGEDGIVAVGEDVGAVGVGEKYPHCVVHASKSREMFRVMLFITMRVQVNELIVRIWLAFPSPTQLSAAKKVITKLMQSISKETKPLAPMTSGPIWAAGKQWTSKAACTGTAQIGSRK
jgi:hypothetical protein